MEPQGKGKRSAMKAGLLAAGLLVGFGPAAAWAQGCTLATPAGGVPVNATIGGVLVETIEHTEIVLGDTGLPERHATATERGNLGGTCGSLASFQGRMMVHAESWVPILDPTVPLLGEGPITGIFHIFPDGSTASVKGALAGSLDFSPTRGDTEPWLSLCGGPCPWVVAQGTWTTTGKNPVAGQFGGFALVPFPCGLDLLCYLDPTGTLGQGPIPLTAEELIPAPSAKFVITLFN